MVKTGSQFSLQQSLKVSAIGVARCFYVAGRMGAQLYDAADPDARHRELDDTRYAVDHFHTKLLRLADGFQTVPGRCTAIEENLFAEQFKLNGATNHLE
jgi:HD superfamily phosphodiesterase